MRKEKGVHSFTKYDLAGNIQSETLPGCCGVRTYNYENCFLSQICSPLFVQTKSPNKESPNASYTVKTKYPFDEKKIQIFFDEIDRLIAEKSDNGTTEYLYDGLGNILEKGVTAYSYGDSNQLTTAAEHKFTYDSRGNLKTRIRWGIKEEFSFNGLDQLVLYVASNGVEAFYSYDTFGRRIKKKVHFPNGTIKELWYLYMGDIEIGTINSSGHIEELQIPGDP